MMGAWTTVTCVVLAAAVVLRGQAWVGRLIRWQAARYEAERALDVQILRTRQAEDQQARTEAQSEAFFWMVTHDLRTPLNAILGLADLLMDAPLRTEALRHLGTLRRSAGAFLDVLDHADVLSGEDEQPDVPAERMDVVSVVSDVCALMQARAESRGLWLRTVMGPTVPRWVEGRPLLVRQLLTNLVGNALKFTEEGGVTVRLLAGVVDDHPGRAKVVLVVEDTGVGIPTDRLAAIFEPYMQASTATRSTHGGTGLGLAIALRCAELLGGNLEVDSEVGQGTTFTLSLDVAVLSAPTPEVPVEAPVPHVAVQGLAMDVLVVEDDAINRMVLTRMLEVLGHTVRCADTGEAALTMAERRRPDVVLTDVELPGMGGVQVLTALRTRFGQEVGLIAVSAYTHAGMRESVAEAGASVFLGKPYSREGLAKALLDVRPPGVLA